METILYIGGSISGAIACVCWITWTFRKGETAFKVAKSGSAAALGLFAISFLIDLVG